MQDAQSIAYKLREIKNTLSSYFIKLLPKYGVTPIMMFAMEYLLKHPDAKAIEVAEELGLTRGAVTQLLDKLEAKDLVVRRQHPDNRRRLEIKITPNGHKVIDRILNDYHEEIEKLVHDFSKEEIEQFKLLLNRLPI